MGYDHRFDDPPDWDNDQRQRWYVVRDWICVGIACAIAVVLIWGGLTK